MKPVAFALAAVFLYAVHNAILEQKLAKYSTAALLVCFYSVMLPLALMRLYHLKYTGQEVAFPMGTVLALALILGAVYFIAEYCFVAAYTHQGSLMMISTIVIMFPVFASLIKFVWVRELPNAYQVTGYILAAGAVLLITKGST